MSARISRLDRAIGLIPWALAVVFGAVAVHLLSLLALPALAPHSAYRRLAANLPVGEIRLLPRATPDNPGPSFSDPFAFLAVCRFDLTGGPLRLRATADGDHPLSVSVRLADGAIVYSGSDSQTPGGRFNILIVTRSQAEAIDAARDEQDEAAAADTGELRVVAPRSKGFALFRLLALREGEADEVAAQRAGFECKSEKPPA
ncbi:hypothetical protein CCR94_13180 [Rhodoblastus sphagnicola]|uniref:DUF1254 domain-containing protein n=1 Tax=Rhodoblastus sphagnicola TaxID=333368 RepID=A0A2S6N6M3_9HYPH|nr:hypothetical protein [Rhodoblastus sphagnicola]MBB4197623.1 putative membrane protein [Rhodoblastus sphagnicola]PPQ30269.1 hypothetical protein CCR94_13180 [Rhodoblastus sphagnicola]